MKTNPHLRKSLAFLWSACILWFYLGSLVNFHQHQIWHKQLIPQIATCKRENGNKGIAYHACNNDNSLVPLDDHLNPWTKTLPDLPGLFFHNCPSRLFIQAVCGLPEELALINSPLRAPPAC